VWVTLRPPPPGVEVGDERERRVTEREFAASPASGHRGHADDRPARATGTERLGGREPRAVTTTSVPPSCTSRPATAAGPDPRQYGSANVACRRPRGRVEGVRPPMRPVGDLVGEDERAGGSDVVNEPTAEATTTCRAPSERSAQRFARYGTTCGACGGRPRAGAGRRRPGRPANDGDGSLASRRGVATVRGSGSSSNE